MFYTVMEYAAGGELTKYVKDSTCLSENKAKFLTKQIQDGIRYIHSKNVIHRDLNPNNLLFIDEEKERLIVKYFLKIKIIDFGISGFSKGNIKEKVNYGTVRFIPPEVASNKDYSSNPQIDIWAIGVIVYFMVTGAYPFDADTDEKIMNQIISKEVTFPKNIKLSATCKSLIQGLLTKNPDIRIDLNNKLFDDWYNEE